MVNRALYGLTFIKSCTKEVLKRRLVTALVVPHLDYCSVVYLDASAELRTRLQRLSNSCVRYIYGVSMRERITPYRRLLGWLRADTRRTYFTAILMYRIHHSSKPSYLADFFRRYQGARTKRTKSTDTGLSSFQIKGAHLWKSLPSSVRDLPSISSFKGALYRYLLELDG